MSKYPRYPAELDRRRKLTFHQISRIKSLYHTGRYTQWQLGEIFSVSQVTIGNLLMDPVKRKFRDHLRYLRNRSRHFMFSKEKRKEIRHRKRVLQRDLIIKYHKVRDRAYKKRLKDKWLT